MLNIVDHLDDLKATLVYLASPYSDPNVEVREGRYIAAREAASILLRLGIYVFSPIAYSHRLIYDQVGWQDWAGFDTAMLERCDALCVLQDKGWQKSKGVAAEIEIAKRAGLPIFYAKLNELIAALAGLEK